MSALGRLFDDDGQPCRDLTGPELRDLAIAGIEAYLLPFDWKWRADRAIDQLVGEVRQGLRATFTAEDVRLIAGDPPSPNSMGARFLTALRARRVEGLGFERATRPAAHACRLRLYTAPEERTR